MSAQPAGPAPAPAHPMWMVVNGVTVTVEDLARQRHDVDQERALFAPRLWDELTDPERKVACEHAARFLAALQVLAPDPAQTAAEAERTALAAPGRPPVSSLPRRMDALQDPDEPDDDGPMLSSWFVKSDEAMLRALPYEDVCRQAVEQQCGIVLCDETDLVQVMPTFRRWNIRRYTTVELLNDPIIGITLV